MSCQELAVGIRFQLLCDGSGQTAVDLGDERAFGHVTPCPGSGFTFDVIVGDLRGESQHRVTIEANEAERWAKLGAEPSRCAEAVMRFLLDREPK